MSAIWGRTMARAFVAGLTIVIAPFDGSPRCAHNSIWVAQAYQIPGLVVFQTKPDWEVAHTRHGIVSGIQYGVSTMQGKRPYQEDRYVVCPSLPHHPEVALFGIFDGHAGQRASEFARHFMPVAVDELITMAEKQDEKRALPDAPPPKFGDVAKDSMYRDVLHSAFLETDEKFLAAGENEKWQDGSTALVAMVTNGRVIVANAGDCRAVLARESDAVALSHDHKPNRLDEYQRVKDLGGFVEWRGVWRVQGVIAISRSFGDRSLKKYIIPNPDFVCESLPASPTTVIMASDGFWDVMTNQEAAEAAQALGDHDDLGAEHLVKLAYKKGSDDNITVLVFRAVGPPHTNEAACGNPSFIDVVTKKAKSFCRLPSFGARQPDSQQSGFYKPTAPPSPPATRLPMPSESSS